jgi:hypothetical protein
MDQVDNELMTAKELISYAKTQGFDLEPLRNDSNDSMFEKNQRSVFFWRKLDRLPCSGRPDEKEGTLRYNMQGAIAVLPDAYNQSASAFQGGWTEAGALEGIEQAFDLVKAWLLDGKEVDELPQRLARRAGLA